MGNGSGKETLEELRSEAESIRSERTAPQSSAREDVSTGLNSTAAIGGESEQDVVSRLEELVEAMEQELDAVSPLTVLIVFTLGVLIGRLLPR